MNPMDFLTAKQWLFLACISYGLIIYFGYKILDAVKEARRDRHSIAQLIIRLAAAQGFDITKEPTK